MNWHVVSSAETVIHIPSQEDFASWAGTSRETVSRVLGMLEKEGFIRKEGLQYRLLKPWMSAIYRWAIDDLALAPALKAQGHKSFSGQISHLGQRATQI